MSVPRLLVTVTSTLMTASSVVVAFVPSSYVQQRPTSQQLALSVMDPTTVIDVSASVSTVMDSVVTSDIPSMLQQSASSFSSSNLLSFADQGQNLAGIFFQASLLPYLLFVYFLSFRGNRIPDVGNFGFQFVLLFVLFTIPSGIISKSVYGCSLADVDWLHGGAELLLTIANILIVRRYPLLGWFWRVIVQYEFTCMMIQKQNLSLKCLIYLFGCFYCCTCYSLWGSNLSRKINIFRRYGDSRKLPRTPRNRIFPLDELLDLVQL